MKPKDAAQFKSVRGVGRRPGPRTYTAGGIALRKSLLGWSGKLEDGTIFHIKRTRQGEKIAWFKWTLLGERPDYDPVGAHTLADAVEAAKQRAAKRQQPSG